jgi:hypothetical protein
VNEKKLGRRRRRRHPLFLIHDTFVEQLLFLSRFLAAAAAVEAIDSLTKLRNLTRQPKQQQQQQFYIIYTFLQQDLTPQILSMVWYKKNIFPFLHI